VRVVSRHDAIA